MEFLAEKLADIEPDFISTFPLNVRNDAIKLT